MDDDISINDDDDRNVRRNRGQDRVEPFRTRVPITINHISIMRSQTAAILRRPFLNPNSRLLPLHELILNGSSHGTMSIFFILSISLASSGQTLIQQRFGGSRGQIQNQRHTRKMTLMCPLSPPGSNTAIILQGNGNCPRLFDGDISLRDGGAIRKYEQINLLPYIKYLPQFIFFSFRSWCNDCID